MLLVGWSRSAGSHESHGTPHRPRRRPAHAERRVGGGLASLCCGTPWKSKGLTHGHTTMRDRVLPALRRATDNGTLPVIVDAASCTEGLSHLLTDHGIHVTDAVEFVDTTVLTHLPTAHRIPSITLHPTCSSTRLGLNPALLRVAQAVAETVVQPDGWNCCAFAGDRGLLHPELTASATKFAAQAIAQVPTTTAYASLNRTCELGMTRATGHPYLHLLELLADATTRPGRCRTGDGSSAMPGDAH